MSVQIIANQPTYRFQAIHPDGKSVTGAWCERKNDAEAAGRDYARKWLLQVQQLGMQGRPVTIKIQSMAVEQRIYTAAPIFYGEFRHVEVDQYGNPRSIS